MRPPRRLKILTPSELRQLNEARLLSYRKKALSIENSPEESDYGPDDIARLDQTYIWFKSDRVGPKNTRRFWTPSLKCSMDAPDPTLRSNPKAHL